MRISWLSLVALATLPSARADGPPAVHPAPLPPLQAAGRMTLPEGFRATLFAAEPDVRQPIAFATDDRGRLWVAENFSYPGWLQPAREKDRILILEDRDGDGRLDRRTVFWDQGTTVSGLVPGFGGVFVAATPNLLFIPDRDGDDVPDGPAEVVLDGWDVKAQHNLFNALNWGPDGWLYGCNGIMSNSRVGRPGTPDADRVAINCGVWRYHPTTAGLRGRRPRDHQPLGARLRRPRPDVHHQLRDPPPVPRRPRRPDAADVRRGLQPALLPAHADLRRPRPLEHRRGLERHPGPGRHPHHRPGRRRPRPHRGDDLPGRQLARPLPQLGLHQQHPRPPGQSATGWSGRAAGTSPATRPTSCWPNDPWFRGMELRYGPDGGVFLTDWSDIGECHENDGDLAHRENGRIYKITYGDVKPVRVDLARLDDLALARLQTHRNDWYVRHARRLLQERAAARPIDRARPRGAGPACSARRPGPRASCGRSGRSTSPTAWTGRRSWTRPGTPSEDVRGWAVRLLSEGGPAHRARAGEAGGDGPRRPLAPGPAGAGLGPATPAGRGPRGGSGSGCSGAGRTRATRTSR